MRADRTTPAAVVLAGLLAVAGCGATEPASARPDPVDACTAQLTYWADEDLRGAPDRGFDYQERGLTGAQADALADLVAQARAQGDAPPPGWIATQARERCTAIVARPPSTAGGWP